MKKFLFLVFFVIIFSGCVTSTTTTTSPTTSPATTATTDDTVNHCILLTSHNSCIEGGVDEALLGSWQLKDQSISSPAGSITNPFSGRTLTFTDTKTYTEDYSTESVEDQTMTGITSHCDVLGILNGTWSADTYSDLNVSPAVIVNSLYIIPNGGTPTVKCQATGEAISSNQASTPLGIGFSTGTPVEYSYKLNADWSVLTIIQENPYANTQNVYTFVK